MNRPDTATLRLSFRLFLLLLLVVSAGEARATGRTFGAGSYIIAADSCWQPNNDTANTVTGLPAYCDPNKNDQSLFQVYALLYTLLDTGDQSDNCVNNDGSVPQQKALFGYCKQVKVYWIIDNTKTDTQAADLILTDTTATASKPIITIYNSTKTGTVAPMSTYVTKADSGAATTLSYRGGPFVIDGNDLTVAEMNTIKAKFPSVKIHKANISFFGNADKVLIGKPPKVAVLNEGASDVLEDYIRAAGLFSWRNTVFQYVSQADVINGCLDGSVPTCAATRKDITTPFQLLWAPHWVIAGTVDQQNAAVGKIRLFLESGNSGFFECASIESLEASPSAGLSVGSAGGFLVGASQTVPRLDTNGGCSDKNCSPNYFKYEQAPFWLIQCGGWNYQATGGHVHNMRPKMAGPYRYLTTQSANDAKTDGDDRYVGSQVTRFIHDDVSKLNNAYSPGVGAAAGYYVYDYLTAGRINGAASEGYVIYMPGHKYIGCGNSTTYTYPPSRILDFFFTAVPPAGSSIFIEVVHDGCTVGSTCPKVQYDLAAGKGSRSTAGGKIDLNAELAGYDEGSNKLSGVQLTSSDPAATTDLKITDIYVTFEGSSGTVKLANIADLTEADKRRSLCAPNLSSTVTPAAPVRCSLAKPADVFSLTFSDDISLSAPHKVLVKLLYTGGPVTAEYNLSAGNGTSATMGNITLDLSGAVYDRTAKTLNNIIVKNNGNCADVILTDFQVTFPGSGTLSLVYNDTTSQAVCSSGQVSPATCSGTVLATGYSIALQLLWAAAFVTPPTPPTDVSLTLNYTCTPACSTSSITATQNGPAVSNGDLKLDFTGISVNATARTISNILLTIANIDRTVKLTTATLTYTGATKDLKDVKLKDTTNTVELFKVSTRSAPGTVTLNKTLAKPVYTPPVTTWSYLIGKGLGNGTGTLCNDFYLSPYLSNCQIDWTKSNTCGIKYVLNTLLALKYTITSREYAKTQPIVKDNILYKSSYDYPIYRGHLKMIKVPTDTQEKAVRAWDATDAMPCPGDSTASFPAGPLSGEVYAGAAACYDLPDGVSCPTKACSIEASGSDNNVRYIFTTLPGSTKRLAFDPVTPFTTLNAAEQATFKAALDVTSSDPSDNSNAIVRINTVRGRTDASTTIPYGKQNDKLLLWAIENSTPALKTRSRYVESTAFPVSDDSINGHKDRRDRILFAGTDDGMLHAFWAGRYDKDTDSYPDTAAGRGTGKEIWAYLPSSLLGNLKDKIPDPTNVESFEPKVMVDGSPALGDFLVYAKQEDGSSRWEWQTRLVGTATIRSQNRGIIFALDVTNPYDPKVLWEQSYDRSGDAGCSGTARNCNMGHSRGVAIGTTLIGNQLKDYVFLTSSWINKKKVSSVNSTTNENRYAVCSEADLADPSVSCFYGVSAYALDLDTGKVMWERQLPYTGDAVNVNEPPAVPALMDRDNNGSYDYVVFGDMQGRLWALRTTDGKNLTDKFAADNHASIPVYQVKKLDSNGLDKDPANPTPTGTAEPIGSSVSVYRDYVVLATGGADFASDGSADNDIRYRVEVIKIGIDGGKKDDNLTVLLAPYDSGAKKGAEKVWAKPAITSDLKVYVATSRSYYSKVAVSSLESDGRVLVMDLRVTRDGTVNATNALDVATGTNMNVVGDAANRWHEGGFVGGFDFDRKHAYIVTLKGRTSKSSPAVLQIGSETDFNPTASNVNPYKVLWWRKM